MREINFVNAQEMARLHPATFDAPSDADLACIIPGAHIKVCAGDERFWVLVTAVTHAGITGLVDNDLLHTSKHGLRYEDTVTVQPCHVYDIIGKRAWRH